MGRKLLAVAGISVALVGLCLWAFAHAHYPHVPVYVRNNSDKPIKATIGGQLYLQPPVVVAAGETREIAAIVQPEGAPILYKDPTSGKTIIASRVASGDEKDGRFIVVFPPKAKHRE